jgi:hypothetical protein
MNGRGNSELGDITSLMGPKKFDIIVARQQRFHTLQIVEGEMEGCYITVGSQNSISTSQDTVTTDFDSGNYETVMTGQR